MHLLHLNLTITHPGHRDVDSVVAFAPGERPARLPILCLLYLIYFGRVCGPSQRGGRSTDTFHELF